MSEPNADRVWNRAALEAGGPSPAKGDRALAALLLAHGLVMNGGVHHALRCMLPAELMAAVEGFSFFSLADVAAFFHHAADDPMLSAWTDENEVEGNRRYARMIPDDSYLVRRFEEVFRERADQFAPLATATPGHICTRRPLKIVRPPGDGTPPGGSAISRTTRDSRR